MRVKAYDNVDLIDTIKKVKDGTWKSVSVDMEDFEENNTAGAKVLRMFKKFVRKNNLNISFHSLNGTREAFKECIKDARCK